ncbi:hypothetical protein DFH07DRAFT_838177 [Mycena maculata]|uniref:Uncharacterized protein n=1 Tax=Mycena maculata TaxID=230809 RepID=A0AAD7N1G2_9AGAR|nr:hypothetical protein DFH07DRAFT_838177 [Mycena maculata]
MSSIEHDAPNVQSPPSGGSCVTAENDNTQLRRLSTGNTNAVVPKTCHARSRARVSGLEDDEPASEGEAKDADVEVAQNIAPAEMEERLEISPDAALLELTQTRIQSHEARLALLTARVEGGMETLEAENAQLLEGQQHLESDRVQLERDRVQLENDRVLLENDREQFVSFRTQVELENSQLAVIRTQLEAERARLTRQIAADTQQNTNRIAEAEKRIKHDRKEIHRDRKCLDAEWRRLSEMEGQVEADKKQLDGKCARFDKGTRQLIEENTQLDARNAYLERECARLEADNTSLEREKARLEADNASLEREKLRLEAGNTSLERLSSRLQGENASLERESARLLDLNMFLTERVRVADGFEADNAGFVAQSEFTLQDSELEEFSMYLPPPSPPPLSSPTPSLSASMLPSSSTSSPRPAPPPSSQTQVQVPAHPNSPCKRGHTAEADTDDICTAARKVRKVRKTAAGKRVASARSPGTVDPNVPQPFDAVVPTLRRDFTVAPADLPLVIDLLGALLGLLFAPGADGRTRCRLCLPETEPPSGDFGGHALEAHSSECVALLALLQLGPAQLPAEWRERLGLAT